MATLGLLYPSHVPHAPSLNPILFLAHVSRQVVRLLQASRLCFLSTFSNDHPHLSLMNFTYHHGKRTLPFCLCPNGIFAIGRVLLVCFAGVFSLQRLLFS